MKTLYRSLTLSIVGMLAFSSCDTDVENIGFDVPNSVDYKAIRAYKESDHEYIFGWFGGWDGGSASTSGSLMGLPDSMDLVSIWGAWHPITPKQQADLKAVQEIKGTKVMACMFCPKIGADLAPEGIEDYEAYWGWTSNPEDQEAAIRKYARAVVAKIDELGYSGLDIDNEPEAGNIYGNKRLMTAFIEELGKHLGPLSGTKKLLCIDGSLTSGLKEEIYDYISYFIPQAYKIGTEGGLDGNVNTLIRNFKTRDYAAETPGGEIKYRTLTFEEAAKKIISACDFELYSATGGAGFTSAHLGSTNQALGFAKWAPGYDPNNPEIRNRKGGAGCFHIENDYVNPNYDYYYVRQMIQIMNPAKPVK